MTTQFAFRTVAVVAIFAFLAGCLAAVAGAQEATPTAQQRTLIASGTGSAAVTPKDPKSNASIIAAIEKADAKALPAALQDARTEAAELATAAGVTLGQLLSLSDGSASGPIFYGPYYGATGTFGPGKYCGNITTRSITRDKNGKRHIGKPRTHRTCRFPHTIQRTIQLTYALG